MKIDIDNRVPLSADETFHLLRDDMPALVPFLYDVDRIEVVEREEDGDLVQILNHWYGSLNKVPRALRAFVKPELMSWIDHAEWSTEARQARWWLESKVGDDVFDCTGTTTIEEIDEDTAQLKMKIDLKIYPERVPGIPRLLARKVRSQIENLIAGQLTPNMENLAVSIRRYAEDKGR